MYNRPVLEGGRRAKISNHTCKSNFNDPIVYHSGVVDDKQGPISQPSQDSSEAEPSHYEEPVEPIVLLAPDPGAVGGGGVPVNMDALLGSINAGGFPPMLDIPPDADDETMVELAIALSLQDEGPPGNMGLINLEGSAGNMGIVNLQTLNLSGSTLQVLYIFYL